MSDVNQYVAAALIVLAAIGLSEVSATRLLRRGALVVILLSVAVLLLGCAPVVTATAASGVVQIQTTGPLLQAGVIIDGQNLATTDARCAPVGAKLACDLGDLPGNVTVAIAVTGSNLECLVTGYTSGSPVSYAQYRCGA